MKTNLKFASLFASILISLLAPNRIANAQRPNFELDCPAGTTPVAGPSAATFNPTTGKFRQNLCIDANGNIVHAGNDKHSGTETFGNLNGVLVVGSSISQYASLSAAIAALPSTGGMILISAGNYTWSTNQFASAPRGVTVQFLGNSTITVSAVQVLPRSTSILCPESFPIDQASVATNAVVFTSTAATNTFQVDALTTVRGCSFQASGAGAGAGAHFYVVGNGNQFSHNTFDGKLYAINLDQSFNTNLCNIYVESFLFNLFQSTSDSIHFTGPTVGNCEPGGANVAIGNWFQKNVVGESGGAGIFIPTTSGWGAGPISGNIFTNNTATALQLGGSVGTVVTGNDLEGITTAGTFAIDANSCVACSITHNSFGGDLNGINAGGQTGTIFGPNSYQSNVTNPVTYAGTNLGLTGGSNASRVTINAGSISIGSATTNFLTNLSSAPTANRTWTFPDTTDTFAGLNTAQTLTNTTLTAPTISSSTFASLGVQTNGTLIYCSDCTIANPCAGLGTGALAKRINGAWVCN